MPITRFTCNKKLGLPPSQLSESSSDHIVLHPWEEVLGVRCEVLGGPYEDEVLSIEGQ